MKSVESKLDDELLISSIYVLDDMNEMRQPIWNEPNPNCNAERDTEAGHESPVRGTGTIECFNICQTAYKIASGGRVL